MYKMDTTFLKYLEISLHGWNPFDPKNSKIKIHQMFCLGLIKSEQHKHFRDRAKSFDNLDIFISIWSKDTHRKGIILWSKSTLQAKRKTTNKLQYSVRPVHTMTTTATMFIRSGFLMATETKLVVCNQVRLFTWWLRAMAMATEKLHVCGTVSFRCHCHHKMGPQPI